MNGARGAMEARVKPTHKINIRGAQAKACIENPDCDTAKEFRAFADRDAKSLSMSVELYVYTGPGTGFANEKQAPFYVARPEGETT